MSGSNWERIQEIFFKTADLPVAERDAFLERACQGNAGLRSDVESLLQADSAGGTSIAAAVASEVDALLENEPPLVGTHMGPYRPLQEIEKGGMGSVFLGERDDELYRKQVAVKVVKRGMDSGEILARFRHERQILGGLEHHYIARLIDGGTTPDGRPFFVMEYVQGRLIDVNCREKALSLESRLRLFLCVCEAISYPLMQPLASQSALAPASSEAFVTELNPTGRGLIYSIYLGGSAEDSATAFALGSAGQVFVTGSTDSPNFPTSNALQAVCNNCNPATANRDVFITEPKWDGSALSYVYSTYLGGSGT